MNKETKKSFVDCWISGSKVRETPEEVVVQEFCQRLTNDYNYPKEHIQTRPQYRVRTRPSDIKKGYPVDIAVFSNDKKQDDDVYMIVECKNKNRKDGKLQLQDYLKFSKASLGVWFNGDEETFLRKIEANGQIEFKEIPNIPQYGQKLENVGKKRLRRDLKEAFNLKVIFKTMRNYLVVNSVDIRRDEPIAEQLIYLIFCKIHDEKTKKLDEIVDFRSEINENPDFTKSRIQKLFSDLKKSNSHLKDVLSDDDKIELGAKSLMHVVGKLQDFCLLNAKRDAIADAFETFIGKALKGQHGQFFTPRNVIKMMVNILQPKEDEYVIDPACGTGGFLIDTLKYVWKNIDENSKEYSLNKKLIFSEKNHYASRQIFGIESDGFLSKVAKAYMTLVGDGTSGIFCEDSLNKFSDWKQETQNKIKKGKLDLVLTNPPFGSKIPIEGREKLKQYELGYKWKWIEGLNIFKKGELKDKESPEVLFIEKCLSFLKDGGRMAIVLPEGIFCNKTNAYIWNFLLEKVKIEAIISLPKETFQPSTSFKTSVLILKKEKFKKNYSIFMADAKTCGHDKNGKEVVCKKDGRLDDDISLISEKYHKYRMNKLVEKSHLGFEIKFADVEKSGNIFIKPSYYYGISEFKKKVEDLKSPWTIGKLKEKGYLKVIRGKEVGSRNYGKGDTPFVRTSDVSDWEIKVNPLKCVSAEVYSEHRQDIKVNDILLVKDGSSRLIGRTAFVTDCDGKFIIQSHILRIRVKSNPLLSPYYLLYLLDTQIVKEQIARYTFTQGTIPTLGASFDKIVLPIDSDKSKINEILLKVKKIIKIKKNLKSLINSLYHKKN